MDLAFSESLNQLDNLPVRARQKSSSFYQVLFDNLAIPAIVLEPTCTIYEFNTAFAALVSKVNRKGIPSQDIFHYLPASDRKAFAQLLEDECNRPGRSTPFETQLITNQGSKFIKIGVKRLPGSQKILATFSEQANTPEGHARLQERAEELEELFFLVSHNLKSPIASIHGFTKLLREDKNTISESELKNYVDRIHKNTVRMSKMVHDLLEFSKAGIREHSKIEVSLFDLLEGIRAECFLQLKEKQIDFRIAKDLPTIRADYEEISAVFLNLVENSIKYMPAKKNAEIDIGWEDRGQTYTFRVKDNGAGIHKRYHAKAFSLFERAAAPVDIEGNGVGLALVKRIVEKHKGSIKLDSQPRRGTTVSITLPKDNH